MTDQTPAVEPTGFQDQLRADTVHCMLIRGYERVRHVHLGSRLLRGFRRPLPVGVGIVHAVDPERVTSGLCGASIVSTGAQLAWDPADLLACSLCRDVSEA